MLLLLKIQVLVEEGDKEIMYWTKTPVASLTLHSKKVNGISTTPHSRHRAALPSKTSGGTGPMETIGGGLRH